MPSRLARAALTGGLAGLSACVIIVVVTSVVVVEFLTERNEQTHTARSSDHTESSHEMGVMRSPRNQDSIRNNGGTRRRSPSQKVVKRRPGTTSARNEENISVPSTGRDTRSSEKTTTPKVPASSQPGLEIVESESKAGSSVFAPQQSANSAKFTFSQSECTEPSDASLSGLQSSSAPEISPIPKVQVLRASPSAIGSASPPIRELHLDVDEEAAIPSLMFQDEQVGSLLASLPSSRSPEVHTAPFPEDETETMASSTATITPFERDTSLNVQESNLKTTESSPESRGEAAQPVESPPLMSLGSDLPTHPLPLSFQSDVPIPEEPPFILSPPAASPDLLETAVLPAAQSLFEYEDDDAEPATPRVTSPELSDTHWFDMQRGSVVSSPRATGDTFLLLSPTRSSSSSDEFDMVSPTSPQSRVDHERPWTASGFGSLPPTEPTSPFSELSALSSEDEDMYSLPSRSDQDESLSTSGFPAENTAFSLSEILRLRHQHDELDLSDSSSESDVSADESTDSNWSDLGAS